jgi:hypothetical protein
MSNLQHHGPHHAARKYAQELRIELINLSLSTLPLNFQNLCPFSLTSSPCPLHTCALRKACEAFNDESNLTACEKKECGDVHLYQTCLTEIDGQPNECVVFKEVNGVGDGGETVEKKEGHCGKRAHFEGCEGEEWKARRVLADLREVHRLGKWGERC